MARVEYRGRNHWGNRHNQTTTTFAEQNVYADVTIKSEKSLLATQRWTNQIFFNPPLEHRQYIYTCIRVRC